MDRAAGRLRHRRLGDDPVRPRGDLTVVSVGSGPSSRVGPGQGRMGQSESDRHDRRDLARRARWFALASPQRGRLRGTVERCGRSCRPTAAGAAGTTIAAGALCLARRVARRICASAHSISPVTASGTPLRAERRTRAASTGSPLAPARSMTRTANAARSGVSSHGRTPSIPSAPCAAIRSRNSIRRSGGSVLALSSSDSRGARTVSCMPSV